MKTNTTKKVIFLTIVIVVLVVGIFSLLSKINEQIDFVSEVKKEIVVESSKVGSISDIKKKTKELEMISDRIEKVLISESNAVAFISLIEDLSANSGTQIQIVNVDFRDPEAQGRLGILDLKFKITGSWENVTNFLSAIESLPYLVNINSLRFAVASVAGGGQWTVDFGLIGLTN